MELVSQMDPSRTRIRRLRQSFDSDFVLKGRGLTPHCLGLGKWGFSP